MMDTYINDLFTIANCNFGSQVQYDRMSGKIQHLFKMTSANLPWVKWAPSHVSLPNHWAQTENIVLKQEASEQNERDGETMS